MKPLHDGLSQKTSTETARLAREAAEQIGEDNVTPWLLVHQTLVQAALQHLKVGVQTAIQRAYIDQN